MTEGMRRYYYSVYANYYAYLANYHQVEELDRKYKNLSDRIHAAAARNRP